MSADALDGAVDEIVQELPRRKFSGKRLILFIVLPILVLGGGGAALFMSGLLDSLLGGGEEEVVEEGAEPADGHAVEGPGYFYDLPVMTVNLDTGERRQSFLSLSISLELDSFADADAIQQVLPRIIDNFQIYLRELRLEDLRGSAGLYRLREELLRRVVHAAGTGHVRDVLFREMLVQ
ncbi:MAG: flagellar basal body-associated FliL family protein [Rhodospirillaceae bacterium]|nr:flagellar basal body-associated FliL family protein [Rhodospirillaceae bacterium]